MHSCRLLGLLSLFLILSCVVQGNQISEQFGVMLQLDNLLETLPNHEFGNRSKEVEKQFELLHEAGVKWTRTGIGWEQIETKPGHFNWSACDEIVNAAKKHHVNLVWIVGNTAPWDSSNHDWNGVPKDLSTPHGKFQEFVRKLVRRYRTEIHYWEIRNEPNLDYMWHGSAKEYREYLVQASQCIKEESSDAKILLGGLGGSLSRQIDWFEKWIQEDRSRILNSFDILNFHVYPGEVKTAGGSVKYLKSVEKKLSDLAVKYASSSHDKGKSSSFPLWITEFDYPADPKLQSDPDYSGGPKGQAMFIKDCASILVEDHPDWKIFWASLLDDYNDPGFESMGLIKSNKHHDTLEPRPSYFAVKDLLK